MGKITLEVGARNPSWFLEGIPFDNIEENAREKKLPLETIKYDGMKSPLSAGRQSNRTTDSLVLEIEEHNSKDRGFIVAFNAGLSYDKLPLDNIKEEIKVIEVLSKHKKNAIVIGHDDLLNLVRDKFPNLKTICSTIQMIDYKKFTSYEDKFEKYDLVVPLNQHTTYEFLRKYEKNVHQIIALFNLTCACPYLAKCYEDYFNQERSQAGLSGIKFEMNELKKEFKKSNIIPSQLKHNFQKCDSYAGLTYLTSDLKNLMTMGVFQFKAPRHFSISRYDLGVLKEAHNLATIEKTISSNATLYK